SCRNAVQSSSVLCFERCFEAGGVGGGGGSSDNMARFDRIEPGARHNDGNRFGRIPGRPDPLLPSCYDDHINLETHQLGRKLRGPIGLPFRISVLDGDVLSFYVATLAQCHPNCLGTSGLTSSIARRYIPYPGDFLRLLRVGGRAKRKEQGA